MIITPQIYAEVYELLNILGKNYIDKVPTQLYDLIDEERDRSIITEFDINKPVSEQDISEEALDFLSYINFQYWCSEEQKKKLLVKYKENDEEFERKLRKKYNPNDIFKNRKNENLPVVKETALIEHKESFVIKLKNFILKLFHVKNK